MISLWLAASSIMPQDKNENMAVSLALAGLAFTITLIIGRPFITWLRLHKMGKSIREELPEHVQRGKAGVPTLGGLMFSAVIIALTLVFNTWGRLSMLLPIGVLIAASVLGLIDDLSTLLERRRLMEAISRYGMSGRMKMLWLTLFGVTTAFILHLDIGLGLTHATIPILGRFDIGWYYIPVATFVIIGTANAVNLTDGLDGLASGTSAIAFCAYGIIAYQQGQLGVVAFCFMVVGALAGFLWFNAHPAQVIMGDTGALALGASLATAAFMTGQWVLLPVVGIVFVLEALSVIIQTRYYKWSGGKRIFRRSPLHHHFELEGWSETQIAVRFWIIGMIGGLLGVALALIV